MTSPTGFRTWLTRRRATPAGTFEYRAGDPFVLPADGGVFDFTVHFELTWSARGVTRAALARRVDDHLAGAVHAVHGVLWPIARATEPHRPEVAERAMNDALVEWCYGSGVVRCRASVRVVADRRVTDRHLPLWERLVELDLYQRVEHRRIDLLVELLTRWRGVLADFGADPLAVQAAKLTDADVAAAVDGLAGMRLALGSDLVSVLEKACDAHGQVGMYELAKSYDLAVRTFARQAGVREDVIGVGTES